MQTKPHEPSSRKGLELHNIKKTAIRNRLEMLKQVLAEKMDEKDYENLVRTSESCAEKTFQHTRRRHIDKFNRLRDEGQQHLRESQKQKIGCEQVFPQTNRSGGTCLETRFEFCSNT